MTRPCRTKCERFAFLPQSASSSLVSGKARNIAHRAKSLMPPKSNLERGLVFVLFFYLPLVSAEGFFFLFCTYTFISSLGDGFMPRKTLDRSRGCGRLSCHRQTNSPSGLGGWLLCLALTLPRDSCQEYRGINRQRCCYTSI